MNGNTRTAFEQQQLLDSCMPQGQMSSHNVNFGYNNQNYGGER